MSVAYRTLVHHVAPSPLGLLAATTVVEHTCRRCLRIVPTDQLVAHADTHIDPAVPDHDRPGPNLAEHEEVSHPETRTRPT